MQISRAAVIIGSQQNPCTFRENRQLSLLKTHKMTTFGTVISWMFSSCRIESTDTAGTYVFVPEWAKHFKFPVDSFCWYAVLEDIWHFLQGNTFAISGVCNWPTTEKLQVRIIQRMINATFSNSQCHSILTGRGGPAPFSNRKVRHFGHWSNHKLKCTPSWIWKLLMSPSPEHFFLRSW